MLILIKSVSQVTGEKNTIPVFKLILSKQDLEEYSLNIIKICIK